MRSALMLGIACTVAFLVGCDGTSSDSTAILGGGTGNLAFYSATEVEPNDTMASPQLISLPTQSQIDIQASLSSTTDIDVYDIGGIPTGDLITVSVDCDSSLDLAAAVFDEQQRLLSTSDDRSWQIDLRPSLSVAMRKDCEHCYVVISASPKATSAKGPYTLTIMRETSIAPAARPQTVYLNFHGGQNIWLPDGTMADIPTFDAANIDPRYSGQTAAIEATILSHMEKHYAAFNVQIQSSAQYPTAPQNSSVLYFGLFNSALLGVADSVDEYNSDLTQSAIIFTDTFRLFLPANPSAETLAIAIANVASHEAGHLLGLEHVADGEDLMDATASADALLVDQMFKTSLLCDTVFPVGFQDGVMLLSETVGFSSDASAYNIDRSGFFANTVPCADNRPSVNTGVVPSSSRTAGLAGASADTRRLLLHGQRSGQGYVAKDSFAVHSRRSCSR